MTGAPSLRKSQDVPNTPSIAVKGVPVSPSGRGNVPDTPSVGVQTVPVSPTRRRCVLETPDAAPTPHSTVGSEPS
jgi:hypothetical protein